MYFGTGYLRIEIGWLIIPLLLGGLFIVIFTFGVGSNLISIVYMLCSKNTLKKEKTANSLLEFWKEFRKLILFGVYEKTEQPIERSMYIFFSFCFWLAMSLVICEVT